MAHAMDQGWLVMLLFWPGIMLGCALLNMLLHWTFCWSELIFCYLAGIIIGACFMWGTENRAEPAAKFFLVFSTGLPGVLDWAQVQAFVGRENLFLWSACGAGASVLLAGLLDLAAMALGGRMSVGGGFLSGLISLFKLPFSLLTTAVGLLFFFVGIFASLARSNTRVGFLGGVFYVEWDTSPGLSATTLGATVQVWRGPFNDVMRHELYHTRQYVFFHDWMIPFWILGMLWGLISSAIARGTPQWHDVIGADSVRQVGNPMEIAAYHA